jgi:dihydrolipoamide dehydrogenase
MADYDFDVLVIGAGPGGYVAAIRAAQLGLKTACAESRETLGGTCLNVGCIPSKALLHASEYFEAAAAGAMAKMGIKVTPELDLPAMHAQRIDAVKGLTGGIEFLFKKNKVEWLKGHASFESADTVKVGDRTVRAKNIVIATGSSVTPLPGVEIDEKIVVSSTGALELPRVPGHMVVIGGGVIGLELGSVWRRLGSEVTILEALPNFLGACDDAVSKEAWKQFTKQGLDIKLGVKIGKVSTKKSGVTVEYTDDQGAAQKLECDKLVVSVGRVPDTERLGCEAIGLKLDQRGFIEVDEHCRTGVANVYAIGDVVRGPMLAHKAEDEGVMAAELIAGQKPHIDYACIPWVIYTNPEIAWVGMSERQAKAAGFTVKSGQFPFSINGRALGLEEPVGFAKVVADAATDRVLGVHIIHARASDIIQEGVTTMEFAGASEDMARIVHAHPTLSEVVKEAALNVEKRSLNM